MNDVQAGSVVEDTLTNPMPGRRAYLGSPLDVAILLPAFNEEQTIAGTIESFREAMPFARIYVIDNNSSDGTADISEKILARTKSGGGGRRSA